MRRILVLAVSGLLAASCGSSSSGGTGGTGGNSSGSGGNTGSGGSTSGSGGNTGSGGSSTGTGGNTGSGGSSTGTGGSGGRGSGTGGSSSGSGGTSSTGGVGGSASGGAGGQSSATGGSGGGKAGQSGSGGGVGGASASSYTCNTVLGIDSTNEWFSSGFENQVPTARWQIIYFHPAYVEDWAVYPSDMVWSVAPTSACSANSDNPDRIIYNAFSNPADTSYGNVTAWVTGLTQVVENLKKKYSRLKRIDLLTMTRGPNNQACSGDSQMLSVVQPWVDSAMTMVAAAYPGLVTVSPKFFAPSCTDFDATQKPPHLSTTGKPIIAKLYGDYYSTEP